MFGHRPGGAGIPARPVPNSPPSASAANPKQCLLSLRHQSAATATSASAGGVDVVPGASARACSQSRTGPSVARSAAISRTRCNGSLGGLTLVALLAARHGQAAQVGEDFIDKPDGSSPQAARRRKPTGSDFRVNPRRRAIHKDAQVVQGQHEGLVPLAGLGGGDSVSHRGPDSAPEGSVDGTRRRGYGSGANRSTAKSSGARGRSRVHRQVAVSGLFHLPPHHKRKHPRAPVRPSGVHVLRECA